MDGIHDLGGRQGFGPIDVHEPEEQFHAPWEARAWCVIRSMTRLPDWNLDWFRHCRELIDPIDYLTRSYYDQWVQAYAAMMVNSGVATVAELASGKSTSNVPGLKPPAPPEAVKLNRMRASRFDRAVAVTPAWKIGDSVRTKPHGLPGHTRLPAYARGRCGIVVTYHGAHVLPDANALGDERAEPLYTVAFTAAELWSEAGGRDHRVLIDLWESHLERG